MLQPFAKAADLQVLVPSMDDTKADLVLDLVSSAIRASVGWDVDPVTDASYTVTRPRYTAGSRRWTYLVLPVMNLTAVSSVVVDGATLTANQYDVDPAGVVTLPWRHFLRVATVTYSGGFQRSPADQAPGVFRVVALEYAAMFAGNPAASRSYTMGQDSETLTTLQEAMDTESRLDRWRVDL